MNISRQTSVDSTPQNLVGNLGNKPDTAKALLESWWPSSEAAKLLHRAYTMSSNPSFNQEQIASALDKAQSAEDRLFDRYLDANQSAQFEKLVKEIHSTRNSNRRDECYHQINSIAFSTGYSEVAPAITIIRGHQAALSLSLAIQKRQEKVYIIDLGCGDGKTGLAIPIICKNISRYHGIDCNKHAIERSQINYKKLIELGFDMSGASATFREASYRSNRDLTELIKLFGDEPTIFISAFTLEKEDQIVKKILPRLLKNQSLLFCGPIGARAPFGAEAPAEVLQGRALDLATDMRLDERQVCTHSIKVYEPSTALAVTEYKPKIGI
jgi:2-polyprenyl-3-methyl-5-hydroxy-6-metoxy-1,4-benzoquinol methylase